MICSHRYIKVNRRVIDNRQISIQEEGQLTLYSDKVITSCNQFPLEDVFDISFKAMSCQGFLYLHTKSGLYSFLTDSCPHVLIDAFKELKHY